MEGRRREGGGREGERGERWREGRGMEGGGRDGGREGGWRQGRGMEAGKMKVEGVVLGLVALVVWARRRALVRCPCCRMVVPYCCRVVVARRYVLWIVSGSSCGGGFSWSCSSNKRRRQTTTAVIVCRLVATSLRATWHLAWARSCGLAWSSSGLVVVSSSCGGGVLVLWSSCGVVVVSVR